jgi:hypothetical protein
VVAMLRWWWRSGGGNGILFRRHGDGRSWLLQLEVGSSGTSSFLPHAQRSGMWWLGPGGGGRRVLTVASAGRWRQRRTMAASRWGPQYLAGLWDFFILL